MKASQSPKKKKRCDSDSKSCNLYSVTLEGTSVKGSKRKAVADIQSTRTKIRDDSKTCYPCSITLEGASVKGRKRKSEGDLDSPRKKIRDDSKSGNPRSDPLVCASIKERNQKAGADVRNPRKKIRDDSKSGNPGSDPLEGTSTKGRKRKSEDDLESPRKKIRDDSKSGNPRNDPLEGTSKPLEGASVKGRKRKSEGDSESPRKKIRDDSRSGNPCSDPLEGASMKERNQKAGVDVGYPRKKLRDDSKSGNRRSDLLEGTRKPLEGASVKGINQKAGVDLESPRKKITDDSKSGNPGSDPLEGTSIPLEGASVKGRKRKSEGDLESPRKKIRDGSRSGNPCSDPLEGTTKPLEDASMKESGNLGSVPQRTIEGPNPVVISGTSSSSVKEETYDGYFPVKTSQAEFQAKYVQLGKLGEGGFGSVYEGHRITDLLPVAIKYIPQSFVKSSQKIWDGKRYKVIHEVYLMVKAAGGPKSSGKSAVITLLDCFDLEDHLILVMEKPRHSSDLFDYRTEKGGRLTEDEAKVIMKQMMDAAIDMHSKGVFHRDIKLENIILDRDPPGSQVPRVRVTDFGCSTLEEMEPYYCYSGTISLAPPEWFEEGEYLARPTTVWHLGALLFELLARQCSFNTTKYLVGEIRINPILSTKCKDFLGQCLVVDPNHRVTLEDLKQHPWLTE